MRRWLAGVAVTLAACSGASEHALLRQFFAASRLRDLTALERIATARFEPHQQGTVLDFDVDRVDPKEVRRKEVTVSALVRSPTGETARRRLVVLLEQREDGRWIVAGVR